MDGGSEDTRIQGYTTYAAEKVGRPLSWQTLCLGMVASKWTVLYRRDGEGARTPTVLGAYQQPVTRQNQTLSAWRKWVTLLICKMCRITLIS